MSPIVIKLRAPVQGKIYTCDACNKKFNSAKAYGGHMRIHSMKGIAKQELPRNQAIIQHPEGKPARYMKCCRCPKTFRTERAFQEHTISHDLFDDIAEPEPDDHNSSRASRENVVEESVEADQIQSETGGENSAVIDLAIALPTFWGRTGGRTGKRGRAIINRASGVPLKKRKSMFLMSPSSEDELVEDEDGKIEFPKSPSNEDAQVEDEDAKIEFSMSPSNEDALAVDEDEKIESPLSPSNEDALVENKDAKIEFLISPSNEDTKVEFPMSPSNEDAKIEFPLSPSNEDKLVENEDATIEFPMSPSNQDALAMDEDGKVDLPMSPSNEDALAVDENTQRNDMNSTGADDHNVYGGILPLQQEEAEEDVHGGIPPVQQEQAEKEVYGGILPLQQEEAEEEVHGGIPPLQQEAEKKVHGGIPPLQQEEAEEKVHGGIPPLQQEEAEEAEIEAPKRVLAFDLNELPPNDDDDED